MGVPTNGATEQRWWLAGFGKYYDQEAVDAKRKADLHRNVTDRYQKLNIAKPVGMANLRKA